MTRRRSKPLLALLATEPGDASSPVVFALAFLAQALAPADVRRVRDAIDRFAARGPAAARQASLLVDRIAPLSGRPRPPP